MNYEKIVIGKLKVKSTAYCTICGCTNHRTILANVYENTPLDIERAKEEIKIKVAKKYTCKICKSIENDLSK